MTERASPKTLAADDVHTGEPPDAASIAQALATLASEPAEASPASTTSKESRAERRASLPPRPDTTAAAPTDAAATAPLSLTPSPVPEAGGLAVVVTTTTTTIATTDGALLAAVRSPPVRVIEQRRTAPR